MALGKIRLVGALSIAATLLGCSSSSSDLRVSAVDPRCRQKDETLHLGADATEVATATAVWTPRSEEVLVRGRYAPPYPGDPKIAPTSIALSKIGLKPGDYIGLRVEGGWRAWGGDPQAYSQTGAVFRDAAGHFLAPGPFGDQEGFEFWGEPGPYTSVNEDFAVPNDRSIYVRIPKGASDIAFDAADWIVRDNCPPSVTDMGGQNYDCPGLTYKVRITEPNRPSDKPKAQLVSATLEDLGGRVGTGMDPKTFPEAKGFSAGLVATVADPATDPQWRGNYTGAWAPQLSKFRAKRPKTTHWGWDLFAPFNTRVFAPVWPAELRFIPENTGPNQNGGYGNIAAFGFKRNGVPYVLFYAHLNRFEGANRTINEPQLIGFAGCSGNAMSDPTCGSEPDNGARANHVHVGLMRIDGKEAVVADAFACDPAMALPWKIR